MRSIIPCFFLLIIAFPTYGQIEIKEKPADRELGEIKVAGLWLMSLKQRGVDSSYIFLFRNLKYQSIIDVEAFSIDKDAIDSFYTTIKKIMLGESKKEYEMTLKGNSKLTLSVQKQKIQFMLWDGTSLSYSQYFNPKQIDKLFGKMP